MDLDSVLATVREFTVILSVFGVSLLLGMAKGRYALINLIFAIYLAILLFLKFPHEQLLGSNFDNQWVAIGTFLVFLVIGIFLFRKHVPGDDYEPAFESFWKKVLLAICVSVLVMLIAYHILPLTNIVTPGTPLKMLFAPQENFFWWFLAPLIALFFA